MNSHLTWHSFVFTCGRSLHGVVQPDSLIGSTSVKDCTGVEYRTSSGLELTEDMVEMLEMYCRINTLGLSSLLDRNCKHAYRLGLENASTKSVFFTSRPVTASSMKVRACVRAAMSEGCCTRCPGRVHFDVPL